MNCMKRWFAIAFVLVGMCTLSEMVLADGVDDFSSNAIMIYDDCALDNGKTTIRWNASMVIPSGSSATFSYDVELADNKKFRNAKQYSTNRTSLTLDRSVFGKHGGRFYVRVRVVMRVDGEETTIQYGDWSASQELVFVKISKTNFPGLYKVLKNGGKHSTAAGMEKLVYDQNKDGWLDPIEINKIWMIGTLNVTRKVNGVYKTTKASPISSFQGVEYFEHLQIVHVDSYSGKKADFSKTSVMNVNIRGITAKQITVNAPSAKSVSVEADYSNKMTKIDLSKCGNAVEIGAYGNEGTKTLKLPKARKNLKILSVSEIGGKTLNMNAYTNLQQLYVYDSDIKYVKVNKCKELRYIYFWYCDNIKSLNLKYNSKLRGADFYKSPGLTATTVKKSNSGKYTWNQGKWWYNTSAYKKDMKKIYQWEQVVMAK